MVPDREMHEPEIATDVVGALFEDGAAVWEQFRRQRGSHFHPFVPADYAGVHDALRKLAPRVNTFLELGSGVGVITILADLMGLEAYGIELDPWLVERSFDLAEQHGSSASFAEGSYVPRDYQEEIALQSVDSLTTTEGPPAYDHLEMDLAEFDLVYVFPWPGEEELHFELMRRYGRHDALLLTYGGTEGLQLYQQGRLQPI